MYSKKSFLLANVSESIYQKYQTKYWNIFIGSKSYPVY